MRRVQSTLFSLLAASTAVKADMALNMPQGVSPISHDIYDLHMTVFWICVAIGIVVFGMMFYAIIYHRKSRGAKPAEFHSHPILEITWTIVPVLLLIAMAIPATKVLLNMNNADKVDITIKATGYQWKWHYDYIEDGVSFFSNLSTPLDQMQNKAPKGENYLREVDHPIVVPIHKKIRFLITSNDVNHAWWVPDLGIKRDAISGFINESWTVINKPGTYRGQCAELCGINHAFMPIVVVAVPEQAYKDWVAKQKGEATQGDVDVNKVWTMQDLMKKGEETYNRICSACHQPGGTGLPPNYPALKGGPIPIGPIAPHVNIVFNGKSGTAMQAFKNQLSDTELAAVVTYERNAWGNNKGDLVQPAQIKALRDGKSMADALATKPTGVVTPPASKDTSKLPATPTAESAAGVTAPPAPGATQVTTTDASTPTSSAPTTPAAEAAATTPAQANTTPATTGATAPSTATTPADDLKAAMARGEKVYLSTCAVCHQPTGLGLPPTFPALKGDPISTGPIDKHLDVVLHGKPGTAMQAFGAQLSDQEIADVVTYERNAWDNNKGDQATADMVKAAKTQGEKK